MPLNLYYNDSPFCMSGDDSDIKYPNHLLTQTQRTLVYQEAIEQLDILEDEDELEYWKDTYMKDMKYMSFYKYNSIKKLVEDKELAIKISAYGGVR